jgi:hypothetical protein
MFRIARFANIQNHTFNTGHVPFWNIRQHTKPQVPYRPCSVLQDSPAYKTTRSLQAMFHIARFASIQNNKFLKGHVPYCKIRQHTKQQVP